MVEARQVTFKAGNQIILHETSVLFDKGKFHVIMGSNGAGKSTLMRLLAGDENPSSGKIFIENKPIALFSRRELAIKRSVLSQQYNISFPHTVHEIVTMGRYPYFSGRPTTEDLNTIATSMEIMDVAHLAGRQYQTLSGGEAQKVQMARVLAQIDPGSYGEPKVLFLDEPVSHLDIRFQYQLLEAAKKLCERNITVIAILHDINLAMTFGERIVFLKSGKLIYDLPEPGKVSAEIIKEVFDMPARIIYPGEHVPVVIF
jgi:iron complex transport system ATP-binding protein